MKKRLLSATIALVMVATSAISPFALAAKIPNVESSKTPEIKKGQKILQTTPSVNQRALSVTSLQESTTTVSLGPNLIKNNSLESSSTANLPKNWNKGGYGTNSRTFNYPTTGYNSDKGMKVSISSYSTGDAKWYPDDITVTPGTTYEFSDYYISNIESSLDVRYTMNDGSYTYEELLSTINPASSYQKINTQLTIPSNVKSVTFFHLINKVGSLTTDEYSLNQINETSVSGDENLIPNSDFEQAGSNAAPLSWSKGGYGTNNRVFTYPATGVNGSKAAKVTISSYTSGDAKWYFTPVKVTSGIYTYSDDYTSNIQSIVTVQYQNMDGTYTYKDISILPTGNVFTHTSVDFSVPENVQAVSVFHLIKGVGSLTLDNASLVKKPEQTAGIFSTGAVTLRFDDGWLSQYQTVLPKLKSTGLKGTFFIVSKELADYGFSGFMNKAQIKDLYNAGNEIGAHTQNHPYLTQLNNSDQQKEIQGSKDDLLSLNVGPITSFAYPYGDYNSTTLDLVKSAGFSDAASTIDGNVTPASDKYQLERQSVESDVTIDQVKKWIDNAVANKKWLILSFHQIDTSGDQYSTTPTIFNQIVDYLKQKNTKVVTIQDGVKALP